MHSMFFTRRRHTLSFLRFLVGVVWWFAGRCIVSSLQDGNELLLLLLGGCY